jgi:hypothetical protein
VGLMPELQAVAAWYSGPLSYDHPGQLAWSSIFDSREAPAVIVDGDGYGILEAPHWLQVGGNPDRADGVIEWARFRASGFNVMALDGPLADRLAQSGGQAVPGDTWFVQQVIDLAGVTLPKIEGYRFRHVHRDEAAARAACHRAAWSDTVPSGMSAQMYERLMETPYYDAGLDWVAVAEHSGEMAASCTVWRCGDVALVEPVGCAGAHRRRGLGSGGHPRRARGSPGGWGCHRHRSSTGRLRISRPGSSLPVDWLHRPGTHPGVPFLLMRSVIINSRLGTQTVTQLRFSIPSA